MHGNAWQWCADRYGAEYYAASPANDPTGPDSDPDSGDGRVRRGGSWHDAPDHARSATRNWNSSTKGRDFFTLTGFRVARTQ